MKFGGKLGKYTPQIFSKLHKGARPPFGWYVHPDLITAALRNIDNKLGGNADGMKYVLAVGNRFSFGGRRYFFVSVRRY